MGRRRSLALVEVRLGILTDPMETTEHSGMGRANIVLVHTGGEWVSLAIAIG